MSEQDTGKFRKNTKDQYYTKSIVAKECIDTLLENCPEIIRYQWIEPSAGNGVFMKIASDKLNSMDNKLFDIIEIDIIGIDIEPHNKINKIIQGDFLKWSPTKNEKKRVVFGNPPFGKQGSLAKAFIQHSSEFADIIALILPRSFVKPSMSRSFPLCFHNIYTKELPINSFEVNGESYDVPCVFQIWKKMDIDRPFGENIKEVGFTYIKIKEGKEPFDIAFRRVGVNAGKCFPFGKEFSIQSHNFLTVNQKYKNKLPLIIQKINTHIFPSNTVGPRSLSKSEINEVINEILFNLE